MQVRGRPRPAAKAVPGSEQAAVAVVNSEYRVSKETRGSTHTEQTLLTRRFPADQHPANVRVGVGMTIATAPFESLRIDVAVSLPCLPSEVEDAYVQASEYAANFLAEEQSRWQSGGA